MSTSAEGVGGVAAGVTAGAAAGVRAAGGVGAAGRASTAEVLAGGAPCCGLWARDGV